MKKKFKRKFNLGPVGSRLINEKNLLKLYRDIVVINPINPFCHLTEHVLYFNGH